MVTDTGSVRGEGGHRDLVHQGELSDGLGKEKGRKRQGEGEGLKPHRSRI